MRALDVGGARQRRGECQAEFREKAVKYPATPATVDLEQVLGWACNDRDELAERRVAIV
jgi:hypothetical protein